MSYDFRLASICSEEGYCREHNTDDEGHTVEHAWFNYTFNVGPMFCHRFKDGIHVINNEDAVYGGQILFDLLEHFLDNKEELEKLNPTNGWGDYDGALKLIRDMVKASMHAPDNAVWAVYS
tara:strand:+ start:121 stop:483 length:363 start_codon:yes stop_codon:yes gene_type:complete